MPSDSKCPDPERGIQHDLQWRELKSQLHSMFGGAFKVVHHHPVPGLHEEHPTSVNHRIGERAIGVVLSIGQIEGFRGQPPAQPHPGPRLPCEWAGGNSLVHSIHRQRAVGAGGAEGVSPDRVRGWSRWTAETTATP